ncbi:cytochrome c peroxidase [Methylomonas rapida]|uniref:cytochrome c peroxidase n=1 Tax=Methylomonas rapida TaxID=2963939 RepID=UPI002E777AB0|nr:cytochrome c peroxidase [Methylomonas rapida]
MRINKILGLSCLLLAQTAFAHGPEPLPLQNVPIPHVDGKLGGADVNFLPEDGPDSIVVDKEKAIALGKALFWDMNVGSDGMACGSCHVHAGADIRIKNQLNPGAKSATGNGDTFEPLPSGAAGGANYTLTQDDFPLYQFANPFDRSSGKTFSTDDVVSSAGTFSGDFVGASKFTGTSDECSRSVDPVFHVNGVGTRRVEPRNVPTMINAIFNYRNFWDGRANNVYNGASPWGDRDENAGIWVKTGARSVAKRKLQLTNSSLASLAMGPPLNDAEMSCRKRTWPDIGRKLLLRQPLQYQKVHHQDSVLGPYSLSVDGDLKPGLNTTYKSLITQAFNPKFWSYTRVGEFGAPPGQTAYNQMEANFSMFFGIALQLYQATLVSDQAPIDLTERDPNTFMPTWRFPASTGIVKTPEEIATLLRGQQLFTDNHCNLCHGGPAITTAAVELNSELVTPAPGKSYGPSHFQIPYGADALGPFSAASAAGITPYKNVVQRDVVVGLNRRLMDMGFFNTGVNDPDADPGIDGVDDFGNPLSFTDQYLQYLLGNQSAVKDQDVLKHVRSCDFIQPLASTASRLTPDVFKSTDGIEADGKREGEAEVTRRAQNCLSTTKAYIPTVAAANATLGTAKMAVANKATFKVPSLRNVELTGPYMHNGSMATLEQVIEFYSRLGNVALPENANQQNLVNAVTLAGDAPEDRQAIIEYMKTFTDDRVRYEKAPFDHPEVIVPDGHVGDHVAVTPGHELSAAWGKEHAMVVPAVGANGAFEADGVTPKPLLPFDHYLAPASAQ